MYFVIRVVGVALPADITFRRRHGGWAGRSAAVSDGVVVVKDVAEEDCVGIVSLVFVVVLHIISAAFAGGDVVGIVDEVG